MYKAFKVAFLVVLLSFLNHESYCAVINIKVDFVDGANEIKFSSKDSFDSAMFVRENKLWFVLNNAGDVIFNDSSLRSGSVIKKFEKIPNNKGYTIGYFEIINPESFEITSSKQKDILTVKITPYDSSVLPDELSDNRNIIKNMSDNTVNIQVSRSTNHILEFVDPFIGDTLFIVTESITRRNSHIVFVDFDLLDSLSGVVIKQKNDALKAKPKGDVIELSSKAYLNILSDKITQTHKTSGLFKKRLAEKSEAILDLRAYEVNASEFNNMLKSMMISFNKANDYSEKSVALLNLAMFFLSNDWYVEAKAVIELVHQYNNVIEKHYQVKLLLAAIYFMCEMHHEANEIVQSIDINKIPLDERSELVFWQDICMMTNSSLPENKKDSKINEVIIRKITQEIEKNSKSFLSTYNDEIFHRICFKLMRIMIETKNLDSIKLLIKSLRINNLNSNHMRLLNYYQAQILDINGNTGGAIAKLKQCMNDKEDRYTYSRCSFLLLKLMMNEGRMNATQYINSLQSLSVIWRGDAFEISVLESLAKQYYEMNDTANAIRVWRTISNSYPDSYTAFLATTKASKAFVNYFKEANHSKLSKLAFFYEFKDLIPLGSDGDEIIMQTASYMIDLDLVEQAIKVMEYQIKNRLFGITKDKVINELVKVYGLTYNWEGAEKTIDKFTKFPFNIANPLIAERKSLYVKSLIETGQYYDAVALLYGDEGSMADELRAEALFRMKDWEEFNENSEPYLYSIRYKQNHSLSEKDYTKILRQSIGYFSNDQMDLFKEMFLDFKPRFKKNNKNVEKLRLFYKIANEIKSANSQNQDALKKLIQQLVSAV